jgi:hypothetical protein
VILDAFSKEDNGVYLECDPERLANALKALGILAYEMCDGPSYRLVVDFDEIRHIYNELENQ